MKNKLLYLLRVGACWYIKGAGLWKGHCYICGKKRKTTAHHLFPKRIHKYMKNENLREIRIQVCETCDKKLHPENKVFNKEEALMILNRQSNKHCKKAGERAQKLDCIRGKFSHFKSQLNKFTQEMDNILNPKKWT